MKQKIVGVALIAALILVLAIVFLDSGPLSITSAGIVNFKGEQSVVGFYLLGIFLIIVKFFCSTKTVSPGFNFLQDEVTFTINSFPFGI